MILAKIRPAAILAEAVRHCWLVAINAFSVLTHAIGNAGTAAPRSKEDGETVR
jgi:hypothetical protein